MLRHPGRWLLGIVTFVLVLDQATKALVRARLEPLESVLLLDRVLALTHVQNRGAAYGLLPGRQPLFMLVSVLVLVGVAVFWYRARPSRWPLVISLALIVAGAVGNLIDRFALGHVTDFVEVRFIDFPVFNVADSGIVVGTAILVVWLLFFADDESLAIGVPAASDSESPAVEPGEHHDGDTAEDTHTGEPS